MKKAGAGLEVFGDVADESLRSRDVRLQRRWTGRIGIGLERKEIPRLTRQGGRPDRWRLESNVGGGYSVCKRETTTSGYGSRRSETPPKLAATCSRPPLYMSFVRLLPMW